MLYVMYIVANMLKKSCRFWEALLPTIALKLSVLAYVSVRIYWSWQAQHFL